MLGRNTKTFSSTTKIIEKYKNKSKIELKEPEVLKVMSIKYQMYFSLGVQAHKVLIEHLSIIFNIGQKLFATHEIYLPDFSNGLLV